MNIIHNNPNPFTEVIHNGPFPIRFPEKEKLDQDEEWCEVKVKDQWKKIRFHDYSDVYAIPGLYETIFYRTLRCVSPNYVASLLKDTFTERGVDPTRFSALDFGAGNGMAAEALQTLGIRKIVGIDILPQAKKAAERDRPWAYDDYFVCDFTNLKKEMRQSLLERKFNLLITVAALGYGDIPVHAFYEAFNLLQDNGWLAFNIKEDFLKSSAKTGFAGLINRMFELDILQC